jgi:Protein of unknown function (DUF4232)
MNDDLTRLENVLRARAAEVPHVQQVPSKMLARARRRIVRNALSSVVAAGLIVAGASAGLAGLGALRGPTHIPESPGVQTSAPPASNTPCIAADLRATATLEGAAGSVLGSIDLTNTGANMCTLEGRPTLTLFSSPDHDVPLRVVDVPPQWQADAASPPDGWPVVSLRPGSAASIRVRWTNPCPQLTDPALWSVDLGNGGGTLEVVGTDAISPPPCNGTATPSTLEVGPFEPGPGTE